jgi:hypothetical protein
MGELIEFYVPLSFIAPPKKWIPESQRGRLLAFSRSAEQRSA